MNNARLRMRLSLTLGIAATALLFSNSALAQNQYYFDPGHSASGTGSGGSGTWNTDGAGDWYAPAVSSSDTTFPSYAEGPGDANFDGVGGNVDVDGAVSTPQLSFGGSGTYNVNADSVDGGSIDIVVPAADGYYASGAYGSTPVLNVTSGNVTVNATVTVDGSADSNLGFVGFGNSGSGTLTLAGTVNFANLSGGVRFGLNNSGSGSILYKGTFSQSGPNGPGDMETIGNIEFDGNIGSAQLEASSGTILLDTGTGYSGLIAQTGAILTNGAITVGSQSTNQFSRYGGTFGGATADESHFEANIANYNGQENLTSVAGGRVDYDGTLGSGGVGTDTSTGNDLQIIGTGITAFTNANGNTYANRYQGAGGTQASGSNSDVGTEIFSGATLLLMNTSGSATGNGAIQGNNNGTPLGLNNIVQLDAGAALGGTGITQQEVVAMGATSVLTPGDLTKDKVSAIGTLHLDNGLQATNGLTVNFDLNGTSAHDMIEVSNTAQNGFIANGSTTTPLDLGGNVTFNFTNTSAPLSTSEDYVLFYSTAGTPWDLSSATFTLNAPTGYTASTPFVVTTNGVEDLDVTFSEVPEPSTYAMMLGGLALLGFCVRRKSALVSYSAERSGSPPMAKPPSA